MVIKKYYSNYTGKQIDEAVQAIIDNQITLDDLSPELIAEIQKWIAEGATSVKELTFLNHYEFPNVGQQGILYIATDEQLSYYWNGSSFVVIRGAIPEIDYIIGGGAE